MADTVGTAANTSPEALLKQAVMGAKTKLGPKTNLGARTSPSVTTSPSATPGFVEAPAAGAPAPSMRRIDPRLAGLVGAALVLGGALGAGATRLAATGDDHAATALTQVQHRLGVAQGETERLTATLAEIGKTLAQVKEGADAARGEARTRSTAVIERVGRVEQAVTAKLAALAERVDQAERDQAGRVAAVIAQAEKRTPAPTPVAVKAAPEPAETGALPEAKAHVPVPPAPAPKVAASDNWAVREVYDGIAVLEDRKRRLVEVGIGDTVPGVGRIETIERRGRTWAVVTRQGVITAQTW